MWYYPVLDKTILFHQFQSGMVSLGRIDNWETGDIICKTSDAPDSDRRFTPQEIKTWLDEYEIVQPYKGIRDVFFMLKKL